MKKPAYLLCILIIAIPLLTKGQDKYWKALLMSDKQRADKLFNEKAYAHAAELYKKIIYKDSVNTYARLQLAECYRLINHTNDSEYWYSGIFKDTSVDVSDHYKLHYAEVLLSNGKLKEAQKWYHIHSMDETNSKISLNKQYGIQHFQRFYEDSLQYTVNELPINSNQSDFYPMFYDQGLIFLSSRKKHSVIKITNSMGQQSFYKTYYAPIKKHGEFDDITPFTEFDYTHHEGPVTFFDSGNKAIISKSIKSNRKNNTVRLGLFIATKSADDQKWKGISAFPFNSDHHSISHPYYDSISQCLFFISNMNGGYGGTDIYKVSFQDGKWGNIENLGPNINTSGNEMFPFISKNILYFSSNGHQGMGGLDIFRVNLKSNNLEIFNLGFPINSSKDDFGLIMDKTGDKGYFSSNRKNGNTDDDIYEVLFHSIQVEGKVIEKLKGMAVQDAIVIIKDKRTGKVEGKYKTNNKGSFLVTIKPGKHYTLEIIKEGYKLLTSDVFNSSREVELLWKNYILEKATKKFIEGKILIDSKPVQGCKITLGDMLTDSVEVVYSNREGIIQHEINDDTVTFFLAEKDGIRSLYKMEPSSKKRKASGITYLTIDLNSIELLELNGKYTSPDREPVESDTLYLRNDLLKEIVLLPVKNGTFSVFVWAQGKYTILSKEADGFTPLKTFIPETVDTLIMVKERGDSF